MLIQRVLLVHRRHKEGKSVEGTIVIFNCNSAVFILRFLLHYIQIGKPHISFSFRFCSRSTPRERRPYWDTRGCRHSEVAIFWIFIGGSRFFVSTLDRDKAAVRSTSSRIRCDITSSFRLIGSKGSSLFRSSWTFS